MTTISSWNRKQNLVFLRYSRIHGVSLTPEVVAALGLRFALKHAHQRRYAKPQPASALRGANVRRPGQPAGHRARIGEMMLIGKRFSPTPEIVAAGVGRSPAPRFSSTRPDRAPTRTITLQPFRIFAEVPQTRLSLAVPAATRNPRGWGEEG
jgi:hypothetical protein